MNLARAEVKRLLARRFTWIMLLVTAGVLGLVVLGVALDSKRPSPAVIAEAEQQVALQRADIERMRAECEEIQATPGSAPPGYPTDVPCEQVFNPDQVQVENYLPNVFDFQNEMPILLGVLGGIMALYGFAVGASFIGAEWSSGSMTNLLLWRPQRVPVLLTKLVTMLVGVLALGAIAGGVFLAALWTVAQARGHTGALTAGFWQSLGLTGARALALALAAAAIGFALASLGRHTATALGVGIAYLVVGEIGSSIVLSLTEVARPQRFQLSSYTAAWLNNGMTYQDYTPCIDGDEFTRQGPCEPLTWSIGLGDAAGVGAVILVLLVGAATWQMVRRDVA